MNVVSVSSLDNDVRVDREHNPTASMAQTITRRSMGYCLDPGYSAGLGHTFLLGFQVCEQVTGTPLHCYEMRNFLTSANRRE
jgi:hypothetical protein